MTYRILVPLDGSPASEAALSEVERIALGGASVHLLHVVPMLPLSVNATSATVMAGHDHALAYLGGLRERLPEVRGLDLIRTGDPADAILQAALEFDINLIAMGAQVRTGVANWSLGSVAERVVRGAPLPVLLRRPDSLSARKACRRILVVLDGDEEALTIVPVVKSLGLRTGAEVVFLHVFPQYGVPAELRASEDPKEKLLKLADRLEKSDLGFWQTVASGDAVEEILAHADTLDVDLIVMSTQAGGDRETTVVGGAAMAVLGRSSRAVILQRPVAHAVSPNVWKFQ
jgi:nucleotide-binding universal stress UspA family protein